MDHGLELFIPILDILEIEVSNILYNPGNIGKRSFSNFSYPGNIGKWLFSTSSYPGNIGKRIFSVLISWKYWQFWIGDMSGCVYNLCFAVEPPRRGFFSARNNISLIFGHVQPQEIALFLDFGPYLAPIWLYLVLIEPY